MICQQHGPLCRWAGLGPQHLAAAKTAPPKTIERIVVAPATGDGPPPWQRYVERVVRNEHEMIEQACEVVLQQGHGAVLVTTGSNDAVHNATLPGVSVVSVVDELPNGDPVQFATIYYAPRHAPIRG